MHISEGTLVVPAPIGMGLGNKAALALSHVPPPQGNPQESQESQGLWITSETSPPPVAKEESQRN